MILELMGYGDFERCPLQWVMLPEWKERVDVVANNSRVMEPDGHVRNKNIFGE